MRPFSSSSMRRFGSDKALAKLLIVAKRAASRAKAAKVRRSARARKPAPSPLSVTAPVVETLDVPVVDTPLTSEASLPQN